MNTDDQSKQPPQATQAQSASAEPVELSKSTTPPLPDQSAQQSAAEAKPLEGKGEKSAKSGQPPTKKKPWSAPVLQFLDEEEETDGRASAPGATITNPDGNKDFTSPNERATGGQDYGTS